MKDTIIQTIQGLQIAKEEREAKQELLLAQDNTELINEYKAKLEEEMKAQMEAFLNGLEQENGKALAKIANDIETINELLADFNAKLEEHNKEEEIEIATEETEEQETEETTSSQNDIIAKLSNLVG